MLEMFPKRNATRDKLIIKKEGIEYILPVGWSLSDSGSYGFRNKLQDCAFAHGSNIVGDGKIDGRTIQVEFDLRGSTELEHDESVNIACSYFAQSNYDLYVGRNDRLYHIAGLSKIKQEFRKGFKQRWTCITVSLLLADPFRYATNQILIQREFAEEQQDTEINFQNPSSVDVPLILTFKPLKCATANSITLVHAQTGKSMQLRDTLLTNPTIAVVNAETGTVYRDAANSLNTFSGIFLHATPGTNTLKYTGSPCNIDIAFTARWFV